MLREHADEQRYVFTGPVSVAFHQTADLGTGRFRVNSEAMAQVTSAAGAMSDTAVRRAGVVLEVNGKRHPLEPPGVVIGRGADADLQVNDPGVSRRHAEIRVAPGGDGPHVSVVDLGSTNGLQVNGSKVAHAALEDGATVKIGNTTLTVRYLGGKEGRSGV